MNNGMQRKPVITLCGSTRFTDQMLIKQWELSKLGHVVMGWNVLPSWYMTGDHGAEAEGVEDILDEVHRKKIDLSDEILVINVDDYIGKSTQGEITYAIHTGKPVKYAYPHVTRGWEVS